MLSFRSQPAVPSNVLSMTQLKTMDAPDQVKALMMNGMYMHRQPTRVVGDVCNLSRWLIMVWFSQEMAFPKIFPNKTKNPPKPCCVC